ncbi:MAG TPA: AI-2E family transporter, partial [Stellaceae bacterium]|nr:AI-2E family transporter [Stellaceae bacterium]
MTGSWSRTLFWIGLIVFLGVGIHLLSSILLPFAAGAAIAFFLDPAVDRLERLHIGRALGTVIALVGFIAFILLFLLLFVPLLQHQVVTLVQRFPSYMSEVRDWVNARLSKLDSQLSTDLMDRLRSAVGSEVGSMLGTVTSVLTKVLTGGVAVANLLSLVFITPIVAFFLLRDWDGIIARLDSWLPRQHVETIRAQATLIHHTLTGFVRGQATVCFLMGVFYAIGLTLIGLDSGVVLGLIVGALIFIPFLGGLTGALMAVLLAFAQFGDWHRPALVAVLFVIGQALEGNV